MTDDNKLESPNEMRLLTDASNLLDRSKRFASAIWLAGTGLVREGLEAEDGEGICIVTHELQAALSDAYEKLETARSILEQKRSGEAA